MVTDLQKQTAQAIVNIFETGKVGGDYANVTNVAGDAGRLTYGRSQTTLPSGNLYLLIKDYCAAPHAQFGADLSPYLAGLKARTDSLNDDKTLQSLLHRAGADPVMHATQDAFFDRVYWDPAASAAAAFGITSALGVATVYDGVVQGGWQKMRDRTTADEGSLAKLGQKVWIGKYIATRRQWLAGGKGLLPRTVYRMDALAELVRLAAWDLPLPLTVRGRLIDEATLSASVTPLRVSAQPTHERLLQLQSPALAGDDVKAVQKALKAAGHTVAVDGVYGDDTEEAVAAFQASRGLVNDGVVGRATLAALGLF